MKNKGEMEYPKKNIFRCISLYLIFVQNFETSHFCLKYTFYFIPKIFFQI